MKKLRIGVIGLGIGKLYLDAIVQLKEAEIAAICDIDEKKLTAFSAEYGVAKAFTDYRKLLADPGVDAVCICSPDHFHLEMVTAALEAGKDVLCEKPLALHTAECAEMIAAAKRCGKRLMVGQVCRFAPGFAKAKELVAGGVIGDLFFAESEYAHDYSDIGGWRKEPDNLRHGVTGGGCHAVDLLRWIVGNPTEVFSYSNKKVLTDWPCDDMSISLLKFSGNVIGKVYISTGCKREYTMRTVLYGTKGTIVVDNTSSTMSLFLEEFGGETKFFGRDMHRIEHRIPVSVNNHNITAEVSLFCDILLHDKPLTIPAEEGAATVAVCEAIIRSAESGKPEPVVYLQ